MNIRKLTYTIAAANLMVFLVSGCITSEEKINQKLEHLKKADEKHKQILSQELESDAADNQSNTEENTQSMVTLTEGDTSPSWVRELPVECSRVFYCGTAFIDQCENANSCRKEAETKARNDLRKQISVKMRSITSSRTYTERSLENESGQKTFQSEIREMGAPIELKNVLFKHFYLRPEKQLQTLARMKRPEEHKAKGEDSEQIISGTMPPLLLAFTNNEKSPNLNQNETQIFFQQRYSDALLQEKAVLLAGGSFKDWGSLRGNVLQKRASEALAEYPAAAAVVLSLSGRLDPFEGNMFKGIATVFLNVAAYGKENTTLFRKSFKVRRFMIDSPDKLEGFQRQEQFLRTVEKGLNEYEDQLVEELKRALSKKQ